MAQKGFFRKMNFVLDLLTVSMAIMTLGIFKLIDKFFPKEPKVVSPPLPEEFEFLGGTAEEAAENIVEEGLVGPKGTQEVVDRGGRLFEKREKEAGGTIEPLLFGEETSGVPPEKRINDSVEDVSNSLDTVGENISDFGDNTKIFAENVDDVNENFTKFESFFSNLDLLNLKFSLIIESITTLVDSFDEVKDKIKELFGQSVGSAIIKGATPTGVSEIVEPIYNYVQKKVFGQNTKG